MTLEEIDDLANLLTAAGRRNVPVPISIWKEMQLTMATKSIGKATVKDGKVKPVVKQSVSRKIASKKKADRTVKALKANVTKSKAPAKKAG